MKIKIALIFLICLFVVVVITNDPVYIDKDEATEIAKLPTSTGVRSNPVTFATTTSNQNYIFTNIGTSSTCVSIPNLSSNNYIITSNASGT